MYPRIYLFIVLEVHVRGYSLPGRLFSHKTEYTKTNLTICLHTKKLINGVSVFYPY